MWIVLKIDRKKINFFKNEINFKAGSKTLIYPPKMLINHFLKNKLEELGQDVLFTREPGGAKGAEEIRNLLVQGEKDRWSNITEILLFFASRRHHLEKVLLPAINMGKVVICDRFTDSTIIYQGRENIHLKKNGRWALLPGGGTIERSCYSPHE